MRAALVAVAAIAYTALSLFATFYAFIAAAIPCDDCTGGYDPEAWQWDALLYLSLASVVPLLATVVLVARGRSWWVGIALALQIAVLLGAGIILIDGEVIDASPVIWVLVLVTASGAALVASRASSRAGAPGTRASRTG